MLIRSPGVFANSTPRAYVAPRFGMPPVYPLPIVTAGMPLRSGVGGVALVEQDHSDRSGGRRVLALDLERARPSLEQRDVAGGEPGEIGGLTAARRRVAEPELDVDRGDGGIRDGAGIGLFEHAVIDALDVRDLWCRGDPLQRGRAGDEEGVELERLDGDVVARGPQRVGDVLDRLVVARGSRCPRVAVRVGDRLESPSCANTPSTVTHSRSLSMVLFVRLHLDDACA